ncbi:ASN_HP2_G0036110.mRNA.1.CDS.1 [Saccharomyces cerevisiae]|nr:BGN_3a_G0037470.mRNA.1.CDS.1 [Saccharomyces cerevisiae]CAI5299432.1 ASN_HP2_G0036110.mRNA.1.CDS.1 [Saccharomyces cerevisiae]CAI5305687.1 BFH_HP2_G0037110.mRNA.1.CDS.1 [Saccharomyces cerevisiae]CAI6632253.1 ASN_HP2_G0036110.mRNA.1.CDS.1 [Saccharomyces cerevisiae]CAI6659756.1 BFH_HP2_G0037110.mRNA.1.CDS.1 [Saccharomyces cerevisiae]
MFLRFYNRLLYIYNELFNFLRFTVFLPFCEFVPHHDLFYLFVTYQRTLVYKYKNDC